MELLPQQPTGRGPAEWFTGDAWGDVLEAHPGEGVVRPPGEEHWHGAVPDRFLAHLALWEGTGDGSPETVWAEAVTGARYGAARRRAPGAVQPK